MIESALDIPIDEPDVDLGDVEESDNSDIEIRLNPKQFDIMENLTARELYYVGAWRSGKTHTLTEWIVDRSNRNAAHVRGMMVALTQPQLDGVILPEMEKTFRMWGVVPHFVKSENMYVWGPEQRCIYVRTAQHPERIEGLTLGFAAATECGQMKYAMYRRMSGRTSAKCAVRQRLFEGRPEGTKTWFERHIRGIELGVRPHSVYVRGETADNPHNAEDYIDDMEDVVAGDDAMRDQVLFGIARDESGSVYGIIPDEVFTEWRQGSGGVPVVGWDFNVGHMVTVVGVWYPNKKLIHVVGEVVTADTWFQEFTGHRWVAHVPGDGARTEEHAARVVQLLRVLGLVPRNGLPVGRDGVRVRAFVDSSGDDRASNAEVSDIALVRESGFTPVVHSSNPRVRNRVAAQRLSFRRHKFLVDPKRAPLTALAYRSHQRVERGREKGQPQKEFPVGELPVDHYCDGGGYLNWGLRPLKDKNRQVPTRKR